MSAHPLFHPNQHHPGLANRSKGLTLARSRMVLSNTGLVDVVHVAEPARVDSSCFAALPFELVMLVITVAARDCARSSTQWVASLTLVCRAIHHAVDAILVETLHMTDTNCDALARQEEARFQRTRHINVIHESHVGDGALSRFEDLFRQPFPSLTTATFTTYSEDDFHYMVHVLRDSHERNLSNISYLRIRYLFPILFFITNTDWLPSVTHLALEPAIAYRWDVTTFVQYMSQYLENCGYGLERLLLRTQWVLEDVKEAFVVAVTGVALARRDTRLWIDDEGKFGGDDEAGMNEEPGLALWYTGRQLYVPSAG